MNTIVEVVWPTIQFKRAYFDLHALQMRYIFVLIVEIFHIENVKMFSSQPVDLLNAFATLKTIFSLSIH